MSAHHIMLVSRLEKRGLVVMKWAPDGLYRVLSEKKIVEWNINTGLWRDTDGPTIGKGISQIIFFLGGH